MPKRDDDPTVEGSLELLFYSFLQICCTQKVWIIYPGKFALRVYFLINSQERRPTSASLILSVSEVLWSVKLHQMRVI